MVSGCVSWTLTGPWSLHRFRTLAVVQWYGTQSATNACTSSLLTEAAGEAAGEAAVAALWYRVAPVVLENVVAASSDMLVVVRSHSRGKIYCERE